MNGGWRICNHWGRCLSGAGVHNRAPEQLEFDVRIPTGDYLRSRSIGMTARFIKQYLDPVDGGNVLPEQASGSTLRSDRT